MQKIRNFIVLLVAYSFSLYGAHEVTVDTASELQNAIDEAVSASHSTTIKIKETIIGNFVISASDNKITLEGIKISPTLNGGGAGSTLTIHSGADVELIFLTICCGQNGSGGGILNHGTLLVKNCIIRDNVADEADGGGIFNSSTGDLTVKESEVIDNRAEENGGAIANQGVMRVFESYLVGNLTVNNDGGAIYNDSEEESIIKHCTFQDNFAAERGGAIANNEGEIVLKECTIKENSAILLGGGVSNLGSMDLKKMHFKENTCTEGSGGAIYNEGSLYIKELTNIHDNQASVNGGAICNIDGTLSLIDTYLKQNTASTGDGGGIYNHGTDQTEATVTIRRSRIRKNEAVRGGGIANIGLGNLSIDTVTIMQNRATYGEGGGGGIYTPSSIPLNIHNSKVFKNHPDQIVP